MPFFSYLLISLIQNFGKQSDHSVVYLQRICPQVKIKWKRLKISILVIQYYIKNNQCRSILKSNNYFHSSYYQFRLRSYILIPKKENLFHFSPNRQEYRLTFYQTFILIDLEFAIVRMTSSHVHYVHYFPNAL